MRSLIEELGLLCAPSGIETSNFLFLVQDWMISANSPGALFQRRAFWKQFTGFTPRGVTCL